MNKRVIRDRNSAAVHLLMGEGPDLKTPCGEPEARRVTRALGCVTCLACCSSVYYARAKAKRDRLRRDLRGVYYGDSD